MTNARPPSFISGIARFLFGEKTARADAPAEQPPRWARRVILSLYLVWFLLFTLWGFGKLGWLAEPRETFNMGWLIAINGYGVAVQWVSLGVDRYYRTKARRALKSAAAA